MITTPYTLAKIKIIRDDSGNMEGVIMNVPEKKKTTSRTLIYPRGAGFFDNRPSASQLAGMASTARGNLPEFNSNNYDGTAPYADPFPGSKGKDTVWAVCHKCHGSGLYKEVTNYTDIKGRPYCFACNGIGGKKSTVSSARSSVRGKIKRNEERRAKEEARRAAAEARQEAEREAREAKAAVDAAKAEAVASNLSRLKEELPEGSKIASLPVTVTRVTTYKREAYNAWEGVEIVAVVTFTDESGNTYVWHSTSSGAFNLNKGDRGDLSATVKRHSEYRGEAQTTVTRARLNN